MLVLLSCAKTMSAVSKVKVPLTTSPRFQKEAAEIALQMSQFSVDELERLLRVNAKIAVENYKRYQAFHAEATCWLIPESYSSASIRKISLWRTLNMRRNTCG